MSFLFGTLLMPFFYTSVMALESSKLIPGFEYVARRDQTNSCDISGPAPTPATVAPPPEDRPPS